MFMDDLSPKYNTYLAEMLEKEKVSFMKGDDMANPFHLYDVDGKVVGRIIGDSENDQVWVLGAWHNTGITNRLQETNLVRSEFKYLGPITGGRAPFVLHYTFQDDSSKERDSTGDSDSSRDLTVGDKVITFGSDVKPVRFYGFNNLGTSPVAIRFQREFC